MRRLFHVLGGQGPLAVTTALEGVDKDFYVQPFPHWKFPNGVALGWMDRLPDNRGRGFQHIVLDWLKAAEPETVLVAGHHLANDIFFTEVVRQGFDLTVGYLDRGVVAAEEVAVRNIASANVTHPWWIDTSTEPMSVIAARLRVHPVVERLRRPCQFCEQRTSGPRKTGASFRV